MRLQARKNLTECCLLLLFCGISQNLYSGWELVKDEDGIRVHTRTVDSSPYKEFRGTTIIGASIASVLGVLDNNSACPDWVHQCESSVLLEDDGLGNRYTYQVTNLPFPVASRDSVMHVNITNDTVTGIITILTQSAPDHYPPSKHVRIVESTGSFELTPLSAMETRVIWSQHVNPAGKLPAFMINAFVIDMPFKSLQAMKKVVLRPEYQVLELNYDEDGRLQGIRNKTW
jgi:hypothetical protein